MKIRYFAETDTAFIEFSNESIVETKEISENLYIDLDGKGNLVSMTIEHAKEKANISEVSYLQMEKIVAWQGAQAKMKLSDIHNSIFYFPYLVIEIRRSHLGC